jgi:predicted double-glycine peptidase
MIRHRWTALTLVSTLILGMGGAGTTVAAGDVPLALRAARVTVPVTSIKEARFGTVVKQHYDFSCGSAAVATLLTYHYGRPTNEEAAFRAMFEVGDRDAIRKQGFSLLDMKKYLASRGLRADGFRLPLEKFAEVGIPAIALVNTKGYRHFVVIKGLTGDDVLVGDPALGTRVMNRSAFKAIWGGILFVIRDEIKIGRANFNKQEDWNVRGKAPFGTALNRRSLSSFTLALPARNEF